MKILWLSHLLPYPPKGGVLQRSYHLLKQLAQAHEVHLLAFRQKSLLGIHFPSYEEGVTTATDALSEFCASVTSVDMPIDRTWWRKYVTAAYCAFSGSPYTVEWAKSDVFAEQLEVMLSENTFDLVHFDTISLALYKNKVNEDVATALDHHNIESHLLTRRAHNTKNIFFSWYYRQEGKKLQKYERNNCPRFDMHITCSSLDEERLKGLDDSLNIEVIPNGVDLSYFSCKQVSSNKNTLIFVGRLNWAPNALAVSYIANELWPYLKKHINNISIDIVGAHPAKELVKLASRDEGFRVHGFVDDVRPYLEAASIYVCPITDGGGTKLKILDALAMGKAIVCAPESCEGIEVVDGRHVLFASTKEEYLRNIKHLLGHPESRSQMGRHGRALVENCYSYDAIGNKLIRTYESLFSTKQYDEGS